MKAVSKPWLALLCTLLTACATPSPSLRGADEPPQVVASWEEGCEDARTVVLLCREDSDECGFFLCRDVAPREVLLAYRGGGPITSPAPHPLRDGGGAPPGHEAASLSSPSASITTSTPSLPLPPSLRAAGSATISFPRRRISLGGSIGKA